MVWRDVICRESGLLYSQGQPQRSVFVSEALSPPPPKKKKKGERVRSQDDEPTLSAIDPLFLVPTMLTLHPSFLS